MQGGFSFCGTDIADLHLEYAPAMQDTYVFKETASKLNEESFDAHDGGYFYGSTFKPKDFVLRCFFEEKHINEGILTRAEAFFRRGRTGRLIFQKRPWIWYMATVTDVEVTNLTNYLNGYVTIKMRAYYPFGRSDYVSFSDKKVQMMTANTGINTGNILRNSGILHDHMTPDTVIADKEPLKEAKKFLLYNGGTEKACVAIHLSGDVNEGIVIRNLTNGNECRLQALSKAVTDDAGMELVCDSMNGKTILTNGTTSKPAFLYHLGGFIDLEPSYPVMRTVSATYREGEDVVRSDNRFTREMIGHYIYVNGRWVKLTYYIDGTAMNVEEPFQETWTGAATVAKMNEMEIVPVNKMDITKLSFEYKPTFS